MPQKKQAVYTVKDFGGALGGTRKYRLAWSRRPSMWHPKDIATTRTYRTAKNLGLAGVVFAKGASERDHEILKLETQGFTLARE